MKIKRVFANNKKKCFVLETKDGPLEFAYSELTLKPSISNPVVSVSVDPELALQGFTYRLKSGKQDSVLLDQVLFYNKDPKYVCELMLHNLTVKAISALKSKNISKRELARKLKTSPRQLYRLLDPSFYGKTIDQMVKLIHVLGLKVEISVQKIAA